MADNVKLKGLDGLENALKSLEKKMRTKEVAQVQGLQMPNVIKWLLDPYRLGMGV